MSSLHKAVKHLQMAEQYEQLAMNERYQARQLLEQFSAPGPIGEKRKKAAISAAMENDVRISIRKSFLKKTS